MNSNKVILLGEDGQSRHEFTKVGISSDSNFDEKWLQERIFEDISLLNVIDPSFEKIAIVPLCREFSLHDSVRNVFLDILAVTATGQLVLVECKLWKNPQARREVVAQIFEYASLLKSLSYGDLVAKLKRSTEAGDQDPILHQFKMNGVEFDEARLHASDQQNCFRTGRVAASRLLFCGVAMSRSDCLCMQLDSWCGDQFQRLRLVGLVARETA